MKLTYWVAQQHTDGQCYNQRATTKKECQRLIDEHWEKGIYDAPRKVVVEYASGFELLEKCMGEGRIYEGDKDFRLDQ